MEIYTINYRQKMDNYVLEGVDTMDTKKKHQGLTITLIFLAIAAVGMFIYSNIYLPNFAPKEMVTIYRAVEDIPAHVDLHANMFKPERIEKRYVPDGAVTDLSVLNETKQLSGKLFKGEILFKNRFADELESEGPLIAELLVPTTMPLQHNDTIRIYTQYINEEGKVVVETLFPEKKVISRDALSKNGKSFGEVAEEFAREAVSSSSDGSVIYVRLTDEEVREYQEALNTGNLFVVKVTSEEDTKVSEKTVSERPAKKGDKKQSGEVAFYEVQEGDNLESIANRFMTTPEVLAELNGGNVSLEPGKQIKVPGN